MGVFENRGGTQNPDSGILLEPAPTLVGVKSSKLSCHEPPNPPLPEPLYNLGLSGIAAGSERGGLLQLESAPTVGDAYFET